MNQVYTLEQLGSYNRAQLWDICRTNGIKCYPKTTDCVEAIYKALESVVHVAVAEVAAPERVPSCADCPLFKQFNDGTGRGLCCGVADTSLLVREHHRQSQDCQNLIDEQAAMRLVEQPQEQLSIPGYSWCLSQGIDFAQQVGSETGSTYWYAQANHYYGKTDRQYQTSCFEKLENAVKAAVDYLGKCGIDVTEVKQLLVECWRGGVRVESVQPVVAPPVQSPTVQSGSLTFKRVLSADPEKTVYKVFRGVDSLGLIIRDFEGLWANSCGSDCTNNYATPYEAAAAFVEPSLKGELTTETPSVEIDSDVDPDFGVLYRVWNSCTLPSTLLGTFYQAADGKWIAQPCDSDDKPRCDTPDEAQLLIVALAGLLVADSSNEVVDPLGSQSPTEGDPPAALSHLLDKPFDELTVTEWQIIKQQALQAEMLAA